MATDRPIRVGEHLVPADATLQHCSSCGAEIYWTRSSKSGLAVPLSVATIEQDEFGQRYALTHFADCPNAKQHRRKRKTSKQRVRVRP